MSIHLSPSLDQRLARASIALRGSKKVLAERAIAFYLDTIQKQIELKEELDSLDQVSDETLINFEKQL